MDSTQQDWLAERTRPLTPLSERRYEGRIAPLGIPDMGCPTPKCVRKGGHDGSCWPK